MHTSFVIIYCRMLAIYLLGFIGFCKCQGAEEPAESKLSLLFQSGVYIAKGEDVLNTDDVHCVIHNETAAFLYGTVEFKQDLDNLVLKVTVFKETTTGGLEAIFVLDMCDYCDEMNNVDGAFYEYMKPIGMPASCPVKAGIITIDEMSIDLSSLELSDEQQGPYVLGLDMYKQTGESCQKDLELIFALKLDVIIEKD